MLRWMVLAAILLPVQDPAARLRDKTAKGPHGMVACEHKDGTAAGVEILERGGNAVDAAVGAAFAMGVAMPSHSGLGGRSQFLIRFKDGRAVHIDGGTQVPAGWKEEGEGAFASVCVPGSPAALEMAHREGGTLPWKEVLGPALKLAEARSASAILRTLKAVAEGGASVLYTGPLAAEIVADMDARGGYVTKEDLAAYKAVKREPLKGSYRGADVLAPDRPASGLAVIEALQILETFDFAKTAGEADRDHVVIEALRLAFEDRRRAWKTDEERVAKLLSKDHARERAKGIDLAKAGRPEAGADEEGDTTHITVVDRDGNACAFTQSLGPWYGAGKSKTLGFYYNATQGPSGVARPGTRHTTGQAPTILAKDGRPWLVLGSAGETRIISAVVWTVHGVTDRGLGLKDALFAPRAHWQGGALMLEGPGTREVRETLKRRGFEWSEVPTGAFWGRAQAALWDPAAKEWTGVADVRGTGTARAPAK